MIVFGLYFNRDSYYFIFLSALPLLRDIVSSVNVGMMSKMQEEDYYWRLLVLRGRVQVVV